MPGFDPAASCPARRTIVAPNWSASNGTGTGSW